MTAPRPLSAAAQAVLDAVDRTSVAGFVTPPDRDVAAAAIRALVAATLTEEEPYPPFDMPVWPERARARRDLNQLIRARQEVRAQQLAIAAELAGGAGQHTTQPTETTSHD